VPDVLQLLQDLILFAFLIALHEGRHLGVLLHLLAQTGDLFNPLVVDRGHAQVIQGVAQGHQVVDVVVVLTAHDDVHHGVEDGALLHGRFSRGGLDVMLDLLWHFIQAVHVQDLVANFVLVFLDVVVGVNLLGEEIGHDLHRPLAEDVTLKDVGQRGLRVYGEDEDLVPLLCQPVGGGRREGGLAQPTFAAVHDVAAIGMLRKDFSQ
jgi:hypothetical protein